MTMLALLQEAASSSAAPAWLQVARKTGQAFRAWATPLILAVGGGFALYRFRRGRTFEKRLKVEVSGRVERATGIAGSTGREELVYLLVTVVVTNMGYR